jgi:hypothetical protein
MSNQTTTAKPQSVWKHGLAATLAAAVVTTALAALAIRAGVAFVDPAYPDKPIPPSGFAVLTVAFSLIGVVLAAILARTARRPRSTFVRTTVVLLVLSVVPDFVAIPNFGNNFNTTASFTLAGLHLVAAAIVIPTLARRLAETR